MSEQIPLIKDLRVAVDHLESGERLSGDRLAVIVYEITSFEIEEGGPYATKKAGKIADADFGLNMLIAYFLLLCEVELPKLDAFLEKHLAAPTSTILSEEDLSVLVTKWKERRKIKGGQEGKTANIYDSDEQRIIDLIWEKFEGRFASFAPELRNRARKAVEKTIRGNPDKQMSLMAHYVKQAFGKKGEEISNDMVAEMGLANIFFWTAFIIYDDFWDEDETADPKLLPIANIFTRHYTDFFDTLLKENSGFRKFFHALMDNLDSANAWETEYCRTKVEGSIFYIPETPLDYGDYEKKYRPASGHILGTVAEFVMQGYALETPAMDGLVQYFRNYLIAMQLNDDAHDWEEDMARGHLSTVVVLLLGDLKDAGWNKPTIDLVDDLPELKKVFWFTTLPKYVKAVRLHAAKARHALESLDMLSDPAPLLRFVTITENVALKAEKEHTDSEAFLGVYTV